jgi:hypothetical protein
MPTQGCGQFPILLGLTSYGKNVPKISLEHMFKNLIVTLGGGAGTFLSDAMR